MRAYKVFWEVHKWVGIVLAVVLINASVSGLLLLEKKQYEWIQPATRTGQEGSAAEFISMQEMLDTVFACGHPDFVDVESIDRVDFRPGNRVYKVQSRTRHAEIQVDAITGDVLHIARRRSDLLEAIHDGSFFGEWLHGKVMPCVAVANIVLALSGLYLWLGPKFKRKRRAQTSGGRQ